MTYKTRKRIWPVSLAMSIGIIGMLAAFLVLAASPSATQAHDPSGDDTHDALCASMTADQQADHDAAARDVTGAPLCNEPTTGNGDNGNGNGGMMGAADHATKPQNYQLQGLDNGARLNWDAPYMVAKNAMVSGYQIERDAWNAMANHPINDYGDATIMVGAHETDRSDLGLAYETVYTYKMRAVVEYDARGWWDDLLTSCSDRTSAVSPGANEPAATSANYCDDYDDLSDAERLVVNRAYAGLMYSAYTRYGAWTVKRTIETADSGGRLMALLDPPTAVRDLDFGRSCADSITVTWVMPASFGTVPVTNRNGVYVGPDYIGGNRAGKEEVGQPATSVTYQLQRASYMGEAGVEEWEDVPASSISNRSYMQSPLKYGYTYAYRVRAMNSAGLKGPWTVISEFAKEPDEPNMPRSLNVDPVNGTVELQWDAPEDSSGLWRTLKDFNKAGDDSENLSYVIERKVGGGSWERVVNLNKPNPQPHKYADNFADTLTQAYTDDNPPVGQVSYRVAALVDGCNPSPYNQKDPVTVTAATLSKVSDLAFRASAQLLGWTAPRGAVRQFAIVINATDDTDYCLGTLSGTDSSYTCTDIDNAAGSVYVGLVIAQDGTGRSTVSNFPTHRVQ